MSLGYHIDLLNESSKDLPCIQVMLASSLYSPDLQVYNLKNQLHGYNGRVYLHWDFIYIPTRYLLLANRIKTQIISKLRAIYNWAEQDDRIAGIVMHTDYPIRYDVATNFNQQNIDKFYYKTIYNKEVIYKLDPNTVVSDSIEAFYNDLTYAIPYSKLVLAPIYLENTTKVFSNCNTLQTISDLASKNRKYRVFGLCIDTEHLFAAEGLTLTEEMFTTTNCQHLVHLNAIPAYVKPGSKLDRHSEVTLDNCFIHDLAYYKKLIKYFQSQSIDCIREVDYEVFLKERELCLNK